MTGGKPKTNRYLERLMPELRALTVPWSIEQGSRHTKILVGGRLATVIPRGSFKDGNSHLLKRTLQNIRDAAALSTPGGYEP